METASVSRVESSGPSRRTVVTATAWSVPAIVAVTATPAVAASGRNQVVVSSPNMQVVAAGATALSAVVKDASGVPLPGKPVSFTGPSGASFAPASTTTDSSGNATTTMNLGTPWARPGSTAIVNAVSGSDSTAQPLTVLGANLLAAGAGYSTTSPGSATPLAQAERVFPSPVAHAASGYKNVSGTDNVFHLVLLQDGTVWAKGTNSFGELGDGTTTARSTWARIPTLSGVTQIATGNNSGYALLADGTVRAWGRNDRGQLGNGTTTDQPSTVSVSGLGSSRITQIAAGDTTGYAVSSGGDLYAWGNNNDGEFGNGSTTGSSTAVVVPALSGVRQVAAGVLSAYAVMSTGVVKSWGGNFWGQLGDGSTTNSLIPVTVSGLSGATQIAAGSVSAYALLSDGSVRFWGMTPSFTKQVTPITVLSNATQISAGAVSGYALLSDGTVMARGGNSYGQLGDGTTTARGKFVAVSSLQGRSVSRLMTSASAAISLLLVTTA